MEWQCEGQTITVSKYGRFAVNGDEKVFSTLEEAQGRAAAIAVRQRSMGKVKLSVRVLDIDRAGSAAKLTITGVNAATAKPTTSPPVSAYSARLVPLCPAIEAAVHRARDLYARSRRLAQFIDQYRISWEKTPQETLDHINAIVAKAGELPTDADAIKALIAKTEEE